MEQEAKRMRFNEAFEPDGRSSHNNMRTKPCTKFFSTAGCPYGENCHFLHYVPGASTNAPSTSKLPSPTYIPPEVNKVPESVAAGYKTRLCNRFSTAEGCRFGKNCNFAHGESDLRSVNTSRPVASSGFKPPQQQPAMSTSRINVKAAFVGAIIGKAGSNVKEITQATGVKVFIRDHDTDTGLRVVELVGQSEQIEAAGNMVQNILESLPPMPPPTNRGNFKTRMCQKFAFGGCTFGDRCHFAHSQEELRKPE